MRTSDLYILRKIAVPMLATLVIALLILLMERMLRLLDLAFNSESAFSILFQMLSNLVPHYMGMALPVAFFLGILVAFSRMSRDNELDVFRAAGIGLHQAWRPVFWLAIVLTVIAFLISGYLQPLGRYAYRSLINLVTQTSMTAGLEAGAFVHIGDMTVLVGRIMAERQSFREIFIYQVDENGNSVAVTARDGAMLETVEGQRPVMALVNGIRVVVPPDGSQTNVLTFDQFMAPVGKANQGFRRRGNDERELTFHELWAAFDDPPKGATVELVKAEFHGRLVRVLSIMFLPFLAIPMALGSGRDRRSYGMVVSLILLVIYNDVLQFGQTHAELGNISPWLGIWLPTGIFVAGCLWLFYRACFKIWQDPLGWISAGIGGLVDLFAVLIARRRRSA